MKNIVENQDIKTDKPLPMSYEALKAERDALAVENQALKAINDDRRMFIMNGVQLGYIKVPTVEVDPALETIRIAVSPQVPTPATDAVLAAIRTESHIAGVEAAANRIGVISLKYNPGQKHELIKAIGREVIKYATELREAK
ncbi:hypothetical protein [Serratia sp. CY37869]|uniref:hypothetical protein n=1 Tax=Serratia sp. CY37869 TaxID=3383612 RepID=UPI003F9F26B4